jgi:D(-)-tartrate dehydratase
VQDFQNLVRYAGMRPHKDWLQPDPSLCYGLTETLRILDMGERAGWPRRRFVPHGGHQLGLHMAAGLQLGGSESYPGVFQPYGGFADGVAIVDGYTTLPDAPGIGIELRAKMMDDMRARLELGAG